MMGRSVWTHSRAVATVYFEWYAGYCKTCEFLTANDKPNCGECGGDLSQDPDSHELFEWECCDDTGEQFCERFTSMSRCDYWSERESRAIAENQHCMVVVSEYCGLVSVGVVPKQDRYYGQGDALALYWTENFAAPFLWERFGRLRHTATASNGEAFYERVT